MNDVGGRLVRALTTIKGGGGDLKTQRDGCQCGVTKIEEGGEYKRRTAG